jgi:hypothetical protein
MTPPFKRVAMKPTAAFVCLVLAGLAACADGRRAGGVLGERGPIAVVGTLKCLPVRAGAPATGCVLGLEDDAARYYHLQENAIGPGALTGATENARVAIAGTFTPGGDDRFVTIGTIAVASLARI